MTLYVTNKILNLNMNSCWCRHRGVGAFIDHDVKENHVLTTFKVDTWGGNTFIKVSRHAYSHSSFEATCIELPPVELFSHEYFSSLLIPSNTNRVTHTNTTCSAVQQAVLNCPSPKGNREEREGQNSWLMASVLNFLLILNAVNLQIYLAETEGSC